ncbi:serine/arginine repetitive matrix protein 1 [Triplophysa rosa]|nr:serine/arginine repetitive matrix protein 1 [Triplophysa rosa]XP_057178638.1 serine/arginine repetitive matrix protein 1 [Triplophysa rosa]
MVRPHSGSPRSKHRPFSDNYNSMNHEGRFGPPSRSPRGFRGPPGKAPPSWRESNSGGRQPYLKRPSYMGERKERHGHWMQHNQDQFHAYPSSQDSHRGRRRPSPPRSSRPPPVQPRQSPHFPPEPPSHRQPLFRGKHMSHPSPSRHFHGPPPERRVPSPHGSFRGPQRRPSPAQEHERSWGPAPRERPFGRPPLGGQNWNGPRGYMHPLSGDSRLSGPPQRKPREFHGRSSNQERWSAERDQRPPHHGGVGREFQRPSMDWAHRGEASPHSRPPYRSPAWKPGPPPSGSSSRFYPPLRPHERPMGRPMKRNIQEFRGPPPPGGLENGPPKRFCRELSVRPLFHRGFRGLTLNDKSRLLKARKFRAESVTRFRLPLPRPRIADRDQKAKTQTAPRHSKDSTGVQPRKVSLKKGLPSTRESSPNMDSKTAKPERDYETKVESRRSVSAHSSSPIDRRLSRDLVVVSHWEAGHKPSTSPKNSAPWRNRAPKNKTESSESDGNLTLNERFTKLHSPGSSSQDQKDRRPSGSSEKSMGKPGSFTRPNFPPVGGVKTGPAPDGIPRKPLMSSIIPRPPFIQKPVFKKSQGIMSKYKNLQTLRHKVPHQRQATSYRRW